MSENDLTTMAEDVLDEDLTLLLAKGEGVPRLGIFNTRANKKKYSHLSWAEGGKRSLKIKIGRTGDKEYSMEVVREAVQRLVERAADDPALKMLSWRCVQILGDLMHMPKSARTEPDCYLVAESKRDTLWFAYIPKDEECRVRPCFILTDEESKVFSPHLTEGKPWPGLVLPSGHLPATMRNNGAAKELFLACPERWSEFLLILSKALLLGFSDWSPDGGHAFGDALWKHLPAKDFRSEEVLGVLAHAGKSFIRQLTAFLRLWPVVEKNNLESSVDSAKDAEERGLKKRERFETTSPNLGDKRFKVTRYQDDDGNTVLGIVPETRLPGEFDRMISVKNDDWEACVEACSLGGQKEPQFTCNSLIWGLETRAWYESICPFFPGRPQT